MSPVCLSMHTFRTLLMHMVLERCFVFWRDTLNGEFTPTDPEQPYNLSPFDNFVGDVWERVYCALQDGMTWTQMTRRLSLTTEQELFEHALGREIIKLSDGAGLTHKMWQALVKEDYERNYGTPLNK